MPTPMTVIRLFALIGLCCAVVACTKSDDKAKADGSNAKGSAENSALPKDTGVEASNATGLAKDLRLLRSTTTLPQDPPVHASSGEAIEAAGRVFARINFVGMSKEDVLWMLGDPTTISDYGVKAAEGIDEPLVYRFDNGLYGSAYVLEFSNGKVVQVKTQSID